MLVSCLGEQHYLQSGSLVQSSTLMTQISNVKSYSVSGVVLTQFKVHLWV